MAVFDEFALGGAELEGEAKDEVESEEDNGDTGVEANGDTEPEFFYNPTTSGGIAAAGAAKVQPYDIEGSGGAELAGTSIVEVIYDIEGSGGAELAGAAIVDILDIVEGSGGAVAAGLAVVFCTFVDEGSGGAVAGGAAMIETVGGSGAGGELLSFGGASLMREKRRALRRLADLHIPTYNNGYSRRGIERISEPA